jgi:hypothetical protein
VAELFTTTRFVVNATVRELLGLPDEGDELSPVDVSELPQRQGLMSHPSMIAGMGDREVGSFVNRGKYLLERLLCRHPTAFPATITSEIQQFNTETTGLSEHERSEIRMTRPECWNCHQQFEPLAFGFSRFDGAGRYVGEASADGKPLPLEGWIPISGSDQPPYEDVKSYMQALADSIAVQTCMVEHFVNFATSRNGNEQSKLQAKTVSQKYLDGGATLPAMVSAVVSSELFTTLLVANSEGSL